MNIQQKNSAHHFRMQSEREQTLIIITRKWFPLQGELAPIKNIWYFRINNKITDSFHASCWHSP